MKNTRKGKLAIWTCVLIYLRHSLSSIKSTVKSLNFKKRTRAQYMFEYKCVCVYLYVYV